MDQKATPATLSAIEDDELWESIPETCHHKAEEFTPGCYDTLKRLGRVQ